LLVQRTAEAVRVNERGKPEMGLAQLIDDKGDSNSTSSPVSPRYGHHEYNDTLRAWVDEFNERFPVEVDIEFIEVSPQLKSNATKLYAKHKEGDLYQYIRVKEGLWEQGEWFVRQRILYLMVSAYFNQIGMPKIGPANDEFKWVCGRVGAATNPIDFRESTWKDGCTPFLTEDDNLCETVREPLTKEQMERIEEEGGNEVPPPTDE